MGDGDNRVARALTTTNEEPQSTEREREMQQKSTQKTRTNDKRESKHNI